MEREYSPPRACSDREVAMGIDLGGLLPGFVEKLPGGLVISKFANDVIEVVVGAPEGSTIAFEEVTHSDREGGCGVAVTPPERNLDEMRQAAAAYRAAGRTPEVDLALLERTQSELAALSAQPDTGGIRPMSAGGGGEELLYETISCRIGGSVAWSGSCRRYHTREGDPNNYYLADESQAGGHAKGVWNLRTGRTKHDYSGDGVLIVEWSPDVDLDKGNPREVTVGVEGYGLTLSSKLTVYPSSVTIKRGPADFAAQWNGNEADRTVGATAMSMTKVPNDQRARFTYRIYEYHTVM
jgi:hypothetical protein